MRNRKWELLDRALRYGRALTGCSPDLSDIERTAWGFEHGYKAAMRDLRKVISEAAARHPLATNKRHTVIVARVKHFLRPMR